MKIVVRFNPRQESRALPIILRHSAGMVLPNRTYILSAGAVEQLRKEGIKFQEISREGTGSTGEGALSGERI